MPQQAAKNRGGAARAGRGPAQAGESAEAGPGDLEPRVVRLEVGFADLKSHFERSEERWEKWRSEDHRRHLEQRKEQAEFREELRKEQAEFREELRKDQAELRKELREDQVEFRKEQVEFREELRREQAEFRKEQRREQAEFKQEVAAAFREVGANFQRIDGKFEEMGQEIAASARRVDEKLVVMREEIGQIDQRFVRRLELAVAVILAAVLGSGIFG